MNATFFNRTATKRNRKFKLALLIRNRWCGDSIENSSGKTTIKLAFPLLIQAITKAAIVSI